MSDFHDTDLDALRRLLHLPTGAEKNREPRAIAPGKLTGQEAGPRGFAKAGGRTLVEAEYGHGDEPQGLSELLAEARAELPQLEAANIKRYALQSSELARQVRWRLEQATNLIEGKAKTASAGGSRWRPTLVSVATDAAPHLTAAFQPPPGWMLFAGTSDPAFAAAKAVWEGPRGEAKPENSAGHAANPIKTAERAVQGDGVPLPHLGKIQASFGRHDVSDVRAHVGGPAAEASHHLGAQAFAFNGHVAFGKTPDVHVAAHEAAHVVQQRAGVALKGEIDQPGDEYEQNADAIADAVERGESAEALLDELVRPWRECVARNARGAAKNRQLERG